MIGGLFFLLWKKHRYDAAAAAVLSHFWKGEGKNRSTTCSFDLAPGKLDQGDLISLLALDF